MKFSHVFISRPRQEAEELARMLAPLGLQVVVQPAFEYVALNARASDPVGFARLEAAAPGDLVVFTSPRAVEHGLGQIPRTLLQRLRVAAIGPASGAALAAAGIRVAVSAGAGYTSEALLATLNATRGAEPPGRAFVIAAPGGREALLDGLSAAGWQVGMLMVYRAEPAPLDQAALAGLEAAARTLIGGAGALGVPLAELAARLVPAEAGRVREFLVEELHRRGVLRVVGGRAVAADAEPLEDPLAARVEAAFREAGFAAPSPAEVARSLGAKEPVVEGIVRFLIEQRRLARVGGKWIVHRAALDGVAASLRAWGVESFEVAAFKERFGLTRKLAIPVLEWLDSQRVTRREGDRRRVLPARPASAVPAQHPR